MKHYTTVNRRHSACQRLLVAAIPLCLLCFWSQSSLAAETVISDQASCEAFGGTWDTNNRDCSTRDITIANGDILTFSVGSDPGFVTNNGTLNNSSFMSTGGLTNNVGAIVNSYRLFRQYGPATNYGTINGLSGEIGNARPFTNASTGVINIGSGAYLIIADTFDNQGQIRMGCGNGGIQFINVGSEALTGNPPIDACPPSVTINQASDQADPSSASPINFTVTFNEAVTGFTDSDVILSGTAGATTATVSGSSSSYTVAVSGMTQSGTVIVTIPAGAAKDAGGNDNTASTSTDNTVTFNNDTTPPVITPTLSGTLGRNGWYTSDVTLTWRVVDNESGVTSQLNCGSATVSTDTTGTPFTCEATSAGGKTTKSVTVKRDATAPTATLAVSAGTLGQNGWYVSNVSVQTTGSDALSGIGNCTPVQNLTADTSGTPVNGSCTDLAGNTTNAAVLTIKLDKTAPVLLPSISPSPVVLNGAAIVSPGASDALSGLLSASCTPVVTSTAGAKQLTCSAQDNAGNTASALLDYTVGYKILGFFKPAPQSKWKAGQTVPIRIALADANGVRIPDAQARALLNPCRVIFSASGAQSASSCMRYEGEDDREFRFEWKLGRTTGPVTITVTVTYPGTTTKTVLSVPITVNP